MKNIWLKKGLVIGIICLCIGTGVSSAITEPSSSGPQPLDRGNWLYVGGSGPGNYTRIQDAIDNASDGDTVFVYDDSSPYYEYVWIRKVINFIGEEKNTTIIDGEGTSNGIYIESSYVTISGFTIQHDHIGVRTNDISAVTISGNRFISLDMGIWLDSNSQHICSDNIFEDVNKGIEIVNDVYNSTISGNIIIGKGKENYCTGIMIVLSSHINISRNTITDFEVGLALRGCANITIYQNSLENNSEAIKIAAVFPSRSVSQHFISKNNFKRNSLNAIFGFQSKQLLKTHWDSNFWGRSRLFPKIILGFKMNGDKFVIPTTFEFDWHPAKQPYDIPRTAY